MKAELGGSSKPIKERSLGTPKPDRCKARALKTSSSIRHFIGLVDDKLACFAPVLSGAFELGKFCYILPFCVFGIHRIQVFDYLNTGLFSPLKKSNQSPFRMAGLCGNRLTF